MLAQEATGTAPAKPPARDGQGEYSTGIHSELSGQGGPRDYLRRIKLFTNAIATLTIDSPAMRPEETGTT